MLLVSSKGHYALASSDNNKHIYVKEPKNVNKDSPKLPQS